MTPHSTDQTEQEPAQESENYGIPHVSTALFCLWEKSAGSMTDGELKWFSQFTDEAEHKAADLSEIVAGIGCEIGNEKNFGSFQIKGEVATLLFNIAHQIDTIRGMIQIGDSANDRLRHPEGYGKQE